MRTGGSRRIALALGALLAACSPATRLPTGQPTTGGPSPGCTPPPAAPACHATAAPSAVVPSSSSTMPTAGARALTITSQTFAVPNGAHPHDVAPASDGGVWYTGQRNGTLGWLDPATGDVHEVPLGNGSAPHGVVSGPDGAAWVTDQGLDAIVRVTPGDFDVKVFPMPAAARGMGPHTGVFDRAGILWFTLAGGAIGRLDPATGDIRAYDVPRGAGPYGIAVTPADEVWFVSLQQSYLGRVDKATGDVAVFEPPTAGTGTRRVWSDSKGRLWVSYWDAGMVAVYDPAAATWGEWDLPGPGNMAYSMYVDELDGVWLSDFGQNAIVRFDSAAERFLSFPSERANAAVRQMLGRPGEAWGGESGVDRLVVFRYAPT